MWETINLIAVFGYTAGVMGLLNGDHDLKVASMVALGLFYALHGGHHTGAAYIALRRLVVRMLDGLRCCLADLARVRNIGLLFALYLAMALPFLLVWDFAILLDGRFPTLWLEQSHPLGSAVLEV